MTEGLRHRMLERWRYVLGFPRTLYFNFRCLPFGTAIKLPVIVSHKTAFRNLSGTLELGNTKTGAVKIGFGRTEVTDFRYDRTIINLTGKMTVKGKCRIGVGSKLTVRGHLTLGHDFNATGKTHIICMKAIEFGDHNLLSWNTLIMDSDQHPIHDGEGHQINEDAPVNIGEDVWIGSGSTLLKGTRLAGNTIVGANSTISGVHDQSGVVLAGSPGKVVKTNVSWR